jgi:predicted Holliday junction resolvase-like endonuclease
MSKFLKFIVHFIVICTIICVVGLALPPFLGVTTEIMDDSSKDTNLPMGSVTYAIPVKTDEATVGDSILYQADSKAYRYMITEMDKETNIFKVIDSSDKNAEPVTVEVKNYIPKVVITIGYVGYLLVATESIEGLIILGLAVLFLVILYIVAELLKKEPQEDDYDQADTEPGYVKSKKELKREEKAREKRYKEEERQIKKEERARRKGKEPERKKIKTGGFVDEIYEDDLEPAQPKQQTVAQEATAATTEAHELLKKEIAAATADEPARTETTAQQAETIPQSSVSGKTEVIVPKVKEQLRQKASVSNEGLADLNAVSETTAGSEQEEAPVEVKRMVIPAWSAAQLAEAAKKQGDAPDIVRDDVTKVTLFDYSDIIADENPLQSEE